MNILSVVLGTFGTLFSYLVMIFLLQKVFAVAKDLAEIREILQEFRRERRVTEALTAGYPPPNPEWTGDLEAGPR